MNLTARSFCSPNHWNTLFSRDLPILAIILAIS